MRVYIYIFVFWIRRPCFRSRQAMDSSSDAGSEESTQELVEVEEEAAPAGATAKAAAARPEGEDSLLSSS